MPQIQKLKSLSLCLGIDLNYLINIANQTSCLYKDKQIPKKNGGYRNIFAPDYKLKILQRLILKRLLNKIPISKSAFGWVLSKSRGDCVLGHVNKKIVYAADISDFFPSIHYKKIYWIYNKKLGFSPDVSRILTKLTTYRGYLPQGAPTSPMITNIILKPFDDELFSYWKKRKAYYSRFGDDIIVSSNKEIVNFKIITTIRIKNIGLKANVEKFKKMKSTSRQEALGLIINKKVNILRQEVQELKNILHKAELNDLESQNLHDYPNFIAHIAGRIVQVKALNPKVGNTLWDSFIKINKS